MVLAYLALSFVSAAGVVTVAWPSLGAGALLLAPFAGSGGVVVMAAIRAVSPESSAGGDRGIRGRQPVRT